MIDKIYYWLQQHLWWWVYQPQDEREKNIFLNAYKKSFFVFTIGILIIAMAADIIMENSSDLITVNPIFFTKIISFILLAVFLLALLIGSSAFYQQEIKFKKYKKI